MAIALAIMRDQGAVVGDGGAAFLHGFEERLALRRRLFNVVDERRASIDFLQGVVELAMPQRPLEPLNLGAHLLPQGLITVHEAFALLV
jgi:hypothetical protein